MKVVVIHDRESDDIEKDVLEGIRRSGRIDVTTETYAATPSPSALAWNDVLLVILHGNNTGAYQFYRESIPQYIPVVLVTGGGDSFPDDMRSGDLYVEYFRLKHCNIPAWIAKVMCFVPPRAVNLSQERPFIRQAFVSAGDVLCYGEYADGKRFLEERLSCFLSVDIVLQGYICACGGDEACNKAYRTLDEEMQKKFNLYAWFKDCKAEVAKGLLFTDESDGHVLSIVNRAAENCLTVDLPMLMTSSTGALKRVWDYVGGFQGAIDENDESMSNWPIDQDQRLRVFKDAHNEYSKACEILEACAVVGQRMQQFERTRATLSHDRFKNQFLISIAFNPDKPDSSDRKKKLLEALAGDEDRRKQLAEAFEAWDCIKCDIEEFISHVPEKCGLKIKEAFINESLLVRDALGGVSSFIGLFYAGKAQNDDVDILWQHLDNISGFLTKVGQGRNRYFDCSAPAGTQGV